MAKELSNLKVVQQLERNVTKQHVHTEIIDDMEDTFQIGTVAQYMNLLTLPGASCGFESSLLNSGTRVAKYVQNMVMLEAKPEVFQVLRRNAKHLRASHPNVNITPYNMDDCRFMMPNNIGRKNSKAHAAADQSLRDGFDCIWLDYMSPWCAATDLGVNNVARDINRFSRAWEAGRPGLLYFTLSLGQEGKEHMHTLRMCLNDFELRKYENNDPIYNIRARGLAAYLNHLTLPHDAHCVPIRAQYYREFDAEDQRRKIMYLMGFHVFPGQVRKEEMARILDTFPIRKDFTPISKYGTTR